MHKIFRYPKFSETPKCSPTKFFGTETKKFGTMSFAYNIEVIGGIDACRKPSKNRF